MEEPTTNDGTNNLVVVSDLHCGCQLGLCRPDGGALDHGGVYSPSEFQRDVWNWWWEFWSAWVPDVTKGEPYDIVVNGDVIDGVHHKSTHQWTHDLERQGDMAVKILAPIAAACRRFYMLRGTEAHVGPSGVEDERVAKRLGAVPNAEGQHARFELWKYVGSDICHIAHHIGISSRAAYESSAVQAEAIAMWTEAARAGRKPPTIVVRSHRHRYICIENPMANNAQGYSVVTAGWQGKTPFAYRIAGGRVSDPQFGGILIRDDGEGARIRDRHWTFARPPVEV